MLATSYESQNSVHQRPQIYLMMRGCIDIFVATNGYLTVLQQPLLWDNIPPDRYTSTGFRIVLPSEQTGH